MQEKIGGVTLDLTNYPGEDYYSEGAAEDLLLQIVSEHGQDDHNHQILAHPNWSTLYHLSDLRGNIADFIPIKSSDKVLEVGAGCGAITGTLAKKAGSVTCIELSKKRSMINATRNKDFDNIEIKVGNFQDVEKSLPSDYDYIMLIGVFEYAASYISAKDPYSTFLNILSSHLKEDGAIYIAIENKYGLKYLAGCREDHTGAFGSGIEGYKGVDYVRTFSRQGLLELCKNAGFDHIYEYYPYPDYKLPVNIYSQDCSFGLSSDDVKGYNFDRDRVVLFDENEAFKEAAAEGMFPFFSNSFLFELRKKPEGSSRVIYSRHSNERAPQYAIRTDIISENGGKCVRKYPLNDSAKEHIARLIQNYPRLKADFKDTIFVPAACKSHDNGAEFEYIEGENLEKKLLRLLNENNEVGLLALIDEYVENVKALASSKDGSIPLSNLDLIFSNIVIRDDDWYVLDYEWVFDEPSDPEFTIYRALRYFMTGNERTLNLGLLGRYGFDGDKLKKYEEKEEAFQQKVAGKRLSLTVFDSIFGQAAYSVDELVYNAGLVGRLDRAKVYFDQGEGFSEGNAMYVSGKMEDHNKLNLTIIIPEDCTRLRIDPSDNACVVKVESTPEKDVEVNGLGLKNNVIFFDKPDPQMIFSLNKNNSTEFHIAYRITVPDGMYLEEISESIRKEKVNKLLFRRRDGYEKIRLS